VTWVGCSRRALLLLLQLQQLRQQQQQQLTCLLLPVMPRRERMRAHALTYPAAARDPCHCLLLLLLVV
jgi:hypothetical protein